MAVLIGKASLLSIQLNKLKYEQGRIVPHSDLTSGVPRHLHSLAQDNLIFVVIKRGISLNSCNLITR
jgi:hypothetical protein